MVQGFSDNSMRKAVSTLRRVDHMSISNPVSVPPDNAVSQELIVEITARHATIPYRYSAQIIRPTGTTKEDHEAIVPAFAITDNLIERNHNTASRVGDIVTARLIGMVSNVAYYWFDAPAANTFWAELNGSTLMDGSTVKYKYGFYEIRLTSNVGAYEVIAEVDGGRVGTTTENWAFNIAEIGNTDSCFGDLSSPDETISMNPIAVCGTKVVLMHQDADASGNLIYWFDRQNISYCEA